MINITVTQTLSPENTLRFGMGLAWQLLNCMSQPVRARLFRDLSRVEGKFF